MDGTQSMPDCRYTLAVLLLALSGAGNSQGVTTETQRDGMRLVEGGQYRPLYLSKDSPLESVERFFLDRYPVTNREFLAFVTTHPAWSRASVPGIFADQKYLQHWPADDRIADAEANSPVTNVSWFAANAYCTAQGKRLPRVSEWELAAMASETQADGSREPGYKQQILMWYSKPSAAQLPAVGRNAANYWGIHDLHGLIWEWTDDFNAGLVTGESRGDSTIDTKLFCAAGVSGAVDPGDYAAFMRYGFRSSLKADFALPSLGFRCAADADAPEQEK